MTDTTSAEKDLLQGDQERKLMARVLKSVKAQENYDKAKDELQKNKMSNRDIDKGRQASPTAWWYILALLGIGAVEWLINYESFSELLGIPAFAAGSTIAVAVMVAFASHVHGEWCRQPTRREQLRDGEQSDQGYRWLFWCISTLFVAALASVVAARYLSWSELSELGLGLSVWPKVLTTLLSNLIVWGIGVVLAFFAHSVGHYTKKHRKLDHAQRRYQKAKWALKEYQVLLEVDRSSAEKEELATFIDRQRGRSRSSLPLLLLFVAAGTSIQTADAQFSTEYDIDVFCTDANVAAANPIRRSVVYVDEAVAMPRDFVTEHPAGTAPWKQALASALGRSDWYAQLESKLSASLMASEHVAVVVVRPSGHVEEVTEFCWPGYGEEQRQEIASRGWERFFVSDPLDDLTTQRSIAFARIRRSLAESLSTQSLSAVGENYVRALSRDEGRIRNERGQFVRVIFYGGMIEDSEYGSVLAERSPRELARRAVERTSLRLGGASFYIYGLREASDKLDAFWRELLRRGGGQLAAFGSDLALVAKVPTALHSYSLEVDVAPPERVRRGRATVLVAAGGEVVDGAIVLAGTFRSTLSGNLSCGEERPTCSSQCDLRAETAQSVYFKSLPAEKLELAGTRASLEGYIGESDDGQPSRAYAKVSARAEGCE